MYPDVKKRSLRIRAPAEGLDPPESMGLSLQISERTLTLNVSPTKKAALAKGGHTLRLEYLRRTHFNTTVGEAPG